ncbi:unnamed protein product [Amoebophrya sp. A25]|nr:unnamed protein product [Amoebophrya sp. A25]|eukprot:GSA25T00002283001.1
MKLEGNGHVKRGTASKVSVLEAASVPKDSEPVRIRCFINGCFDLLHFGHLNALRQVKQYAHADLIPEGDAQIEKARSSSHSKAVDVVADADASALNRARLSQQSSSLTRLSASRKGDSLRDVPLPPPASSDSEDILSFVEPASSSSADEPDSVANGPSPAPRSSASSKNTLLMTSSNIELHVIAGVHSNAEIRRVKGGAFINSEHEKERLLLACRFVDEVAQDVPYGVIQPDVYSADFVFHGDDEIRLPGGGDMYSKAKDGEKFRYIRRTEGISTTLMVERFFNMTSATAREMKDEKDKINVPAVTDKGVHKTTRTLQHAVDVEEDEEFDTMNAGAQRIARFVQEAAFTRQKQESKSKSVDPQMSTGGKDDAAAVATTPLLNDIHPERRVVYIQGYWDLLHVGYLDILEEIRAREQEAAQKRGVEFDIYLICGILEKMKPPVVPSGKGLMKIGANRNNDRHTAAAAKTLIKGNGCIKETVDDYSAPGPVISEAESMTTVEGMGADVHQDQSLPTPDEVTEDAKAAEEHKGEDGSPRFLKNFNSEKPYKMVVDRFFTSPASLAGGVEQQGRISSRNENTCLFQTVHERGLAMLSLRLVDDVVFGVTQHRFSENFRRSLGIDVVYTVTGHPDFEGVREELYADKVVEGGSILSSADIVQRFAANRSDFERRQAVKKEPELNPTGAKTKSLS